MSKKNEEYEYSRGNINIKEYPSDRNVKEDTELFKEFEEFSKSRGVSNSLKENKSIMEKEKFSQKKKEENIHNRKEKNDNSHIEKIETKKNLDNRGDCCNKDILKNRENILDSIGYKEENTAPNTYHSKKKSTLSTIIDFLKKPSVKNTFIIGTLASWVLPVFEFIQKISNTNSVIQKFFSSFLDKKNKEKNKIRKKDEGKYENNDIKNVKISVVNTNTVNEKDKKFERMKIEEKTIDRDIKNLESEIKSISKDKEKNKNQNRNDKKSRKKEIQNLEQDAKHLDVRIKHLSKEKNKKNLSKEEKESLTEKLKIFIKKFSIINILLGLLNDETKKDESGKKVEELSIKEKIYKMIQLGLYHLGGKYIYGGKEFFKNGEKGGLDCSGFTYQLYKSIGINIPKASFLQADDKNGRLIKYKKDLKKGDLVFFLTDRKRAQREKIKVTHVAIYIGDGKILHARSSKKGIRIDKLEGGDFKGKFKWARRYV